jgi:hypothetical protein
MSRSAHSARARTLRLCVMAAVACWGCGGRGTAPGADTEVLDDTTESTTTDTAVAGGRTGSASRPNATGVRASAGGRMSDGGGDAVSGGSAGTAQRAGTGGSSGSSSMTMSSAGAGSGGHGGQGAGASATGSAAGSGAMAGAHGAGASAAGGGGGMHAAAGSGGGGEVQPCATATDPFRKLECVEGDCVQCERAAMQPIACTSAHDHCVNMAGTATAGPGAGKPRAALCADLLACVRRTSCVGSYNWSDCLCGVNVSTDACFTASSIGSLTGACRDEIVTAAEVPANDPSPLATLAVRLEDPSYPVGAAAALISGCDYLHCAYACKVCAPGVDPGCSASAGAGGHAGAAGTAGHAGAGGASGVGGSGGEAGRAGSGGTAGGNMAAGSGGSLGLGGRSASIGGSGGSGGGGGSGAGASGRSSAAGNGGVAGVNGAGPA